MAEPELSAAAELIRLRYPGMCDVCREAVPARTMAWYDRSTRRVRCQGCTGPLPRSPEGGEPATAGPPPVSGEAGSSARRQYESWSARHRARVDARMADDAAWRAEIRHKRPIIGRLATALTPRPDTRTPQHVEAWRSGADGEEIVGSRLNAWAAEEPGRYVLHDRRIPRSRANIDHLVIAPTGVWVIDTKEYSGSVQHVNRGGLLFPDWRLKVGGRDQSRLADDVGWQQSIVAEALDRSPLAGHRPPVFGVLCFVGAEWSLFSRPFTFVGVSVAWPAAMVKLISEAGDWAEDTRGSTAEFLAREFRPA